LRLTEQRQYSYVIRFLNAAIEFCAVVIEEKEKQTRLRLIIMK
jgi:hypothetical protein